jgi:hypothetical protein
MNWTRHDTRALIEAAADRPCISIGVVKTIRRHHGEEGLVERIARLERFMTEQAVPHVWGASDCALLLGDWAVANGHPDPADHLRGTYDSEEACRALLVAAGGLPAVVRGCAARIGLRALREPSFGAVGVIGSAINQSRQWAGIWQGHRWMVRWLSPDGRPTWALFSAKPLAMWAI